MRNTFTYVLLLVFVVASYTSKAQQNIIVGGDMEAADADSWSVTTLETDASNSSSFGFGYTDDIPYEGTDGCLHFTIENSGTNGAHLMFYQEVTLQKGKRYVLNMAAKAKQEMNNSWFEVYLGTTEPADGADYGSGQKALGGFKWSGWDAGCTGLDLFDGTLRADGCLAGSSDTISVDEDGVFYIGFKAGIWATATVVEFVVDNISLIDVDETVAVKNNKASTTSIYPNPVNQYLYLQADEKIIEANILNILGQSVLKVNKVNNGLDLSSLRSGVYLLELKYANQNVEVKKFQKN